jgi:hypothetical protein
MPPGTRPNPDLTYGLENGTMFRIPREFCDGTNPINYVINKELMTWLDSRNDPQSPTHRIINSWGVVIEFFDDDFKLEYMLTWSTQADWPELLEKEEK